MQMGRPDTRLIEAASELEIENGSSTARLQDNAGLPPEELKKRRRSSGPEAVKLHIKHLRGEHGRIQHDSALCISDESEPGS
jgi:hypothetical protein